MEQEFADGEETSSSGPIMPPSTRDITTKCDRQDDDDVPFPGCSTCELCESKKVARNGPEISIILVVASCQFDMEAAEPN